MHRFGYAAGMATTKPRITITLKPSTHAALVRMSVLTKNSQSAIVGELLTSAEPVFVRMVRIIEAANKAKEGAQGHVLRGLEDAQAVLERQLGLIETDVDTRMVDMLDGLEQVARRSGRKGDGRVAPATGRPIRPPLLTGGSGRPTRTRKTQAHKMRKPLK